MRVREHKIIFVRDYWRILGLIFTLLGLTLIGVTLSIAWISGVSFLDHLALYEFLWTNRFDVGFGISLEFLYFVIGGVGALIVGIILFQRKTEHIKEMTVITEDFPVKTLDLTVILKCTNCNHRWKEEFSKTQLQAMGFPQNRTISRRRCPSCKKFTRPKIVQI